MGSIYFVMLNLVQHLVYVVQRSWNKFRMTMGSRFEWVPLFQLCWAVLNFAGSSRKGQLIKTCFVTCKYYYRLYFLNCQEGNYSLPDIGFTAGGTSSLQTLQSLCRDCCVCLYSLHPERSVSAPLAATLLLYSIFKRAYLWTSHEYYRIIIGYIFLFVKRYFI